MTQFSNLPYAVPNANKYNETLEYILDASREIDQYLDRLRSGLFIHPATYRLSSRAGSRLAFSEYPIYSITSITNNNTAVSEYDIEGEQSTIVRLGEMITGDVIVTGFFGYGLKTKVDDLLNGQTFDEHENVFSSQKFTTGITGTIGQVFAIRNEIIYHNGTTLLRGQNGTAAVDHAYEADGDNNLYRLSLPLTISEATAVISQRIESMRATARDSEIEMIDAEDIRAEVLLAHFEHKLKYYKNKGTVFGYGP